MDTGVTWGQTRGVANRVPGLGGIVLDKASTQMFTYKTWGKVGEGDGKGKELIVILTQSCIANSTGSLM